MPRPQWAPAADTAAERVEGLPLLLSGDTFDALEAAAGRRRLSPGELVHQLIAGFLRQEHRAAAGPARLSRLRDCNGDHGR
jgi:hypothetical protein